MKDLRCLLGVHSYADHHVDDGSGVYRECRRCGKVDPSADPSGEMLKSQNPFSN